MSNLPLTDIIKFLINDSASAIHTDNVTNCLKPLGNRRDSMHARGKMGDIACTRQTCDSYSNFPPIRPTENLLYRPSAASLEDHHTAHAHNRTY